MGMKENFKQAAKELMNAPIPAGKKDEDVLPDRPVEQPAESARRFAAVPAPAPKSVAFEPELSTQHTIIAAGDSIRGDLTCTGSVDLYGTLTGNINGNGDLLLCGKLLGDAAGKNLVLRSGVVNGNINATGSVTVDSGSMVIGNISAASLVLNGKVKGDLDIKGDLSMENSAAVLGKISTGSISMVEGAAFSGEVSIRSVDFNTIFNEHEKKGN